MTQKIAEVEEAKALMTEAIEWSVVRWLREKKRVRKTADKANAALDRLVEQAKAESHEDIKAAYRVRMDAEDTFDEAERELSARLAREGCKKAIHSWELYERAIRKSEAATKSGE